jgi:hypothetical protein
MAFLRSLTHVELKKQLATIAGIKSGDDVAIAKPMVWKLADVCVTLHYHTISPHLSFSFHP